MMYACHDTDFWTYQKHFNKSIHESWSKCSVHVQAVHYSGMYIVHVQAYSCTRGTPHICSEQNTYFTICLNLKLSFIKKKKRQ